MKARCSGVKQNEIDRYNQSQKQKADYVIVIRSSNGEKAKSPLGTWGPGQGKTKVMKIPGKTQKKQSLSLLPCAKIKIQKNVVDQSRRLTRNYP